MLLLGLQVRLKGLWSSRLFLQQCYQWHRLLQSVFILLSKAGISSRSWVWGSCMVSALIVAMRLYLPH